jgi:hypothetical protein
MRTIKGFKLEATHFLVADGSAMKTMLSMPKRVSPAAHFSGMLRALVVTGACVTVTRSNIFIHEPGLTFGRMTDPILVMFVHLLKHPGHKGLEDSQWRQMELQKELYHWLNERGVYINAPDWYFFDGTNKIAIGYREVNFSLSRDQQKILNRQNIYDGLWKKHRR